MRGEGGRTRLLILPPLFEEMNRTRRLLALTGAHLAAAGVETWLPDLPATGDHEDASDAAEWGRWRAAVAELAAFLGWPHLLAVRGGALLADAARPQSAYFLAPVAHGERIVRDLLRTRIAADAALGLTISAAALAAALAAGLTIEAAGYPIAPAMAAAIAGATLAAAACPTRTATLSDATGADIAFLHPPVWRQSEPDPPTELAAALADDLCAWLPR